MMQGGVLLLFLQRQRMSSNYRSLSNSFIAWTKELSEACTKPKKLGKVLEVMRRAAKQGLKLVHARHVVDLLRELTRRRVGTSTVERQCKRICSGLPQRRKNTMVNRVMRWKLDDARRCLGKERYMNTKGWRRWKPIISHAGVKQEYDSWWRREKSRMKRYLKASRKKKVKFLEQRYGKIKEK